MKKFNNFRHFSNYVAIIKTTLSVLFASSKKYFILILVLSSVMALPDIINLIVWQHIIDQIGSLLINDNRDYISIIYLFFLHFIIVLIKLIINKTTNYVKEIYTVLVDKYITNRTIEIVDSMEMQDIEDPRLHNDIQKTNDESTVRSIGILNNIVEIIMNMSLFVGTISILASYQVSIVIIIILSIIPSTIINLKSMSKLFEVYDKRYEKTRYYSSLKDMIVTYENFKEMKLFSNISFIQNIINNIFEQIIEQDKNVKKTLTIKSTVGDSIQQLLTYLFKIIIVINGIMSKLSIGVIIMSIETATKLQNALINLISYALTLYENCLYLLSFERLNKINLIKSEEIREDLIKDFVVDSIEFIGVYFKYPSSNSYILENINLTLKKGFDYAVVGYNGSGKTTLIKLILGLYAPTKGEILINGINRTMYDKKAYFEKMSAMFQDFVKFPLTIRENIGISMTNNIKDMPVIIEASVLGQAYDFINELNRKFDTNLLIGWENSEDISTGQWQRLAISRSFVREADVMVFDEPTAALDAKTESEVFKNMVNKKTDRINIIITHRFTNIKNIDQIIVIHEGKVDAVGDHDFLMSNNKIYAELYDIQADNYKGFIKESSIAGELLK
ncbi:ABC transporter ATP-binding protein [Paenibacillus sp. FSL L8-0689]|uniref:ABC transporter ATP-binding protein n=1 Tax=Paenibacillus sp. FSL L8-0689 TaxID=2921607 RepID=UPI0030F4E6B6